jgi:hypothetical protein
VFALLLRLGTSQSCEATTSAPLSAWLEPLATQQCLDALQLAARSHGTQPIALKVARELDQLLYTSLFHIAAGVVSRIQISSVSSRIPT